MAVFGCAALGGLYRPTTEEAAHASLEVAWRLGVRKFDTAPHYGVGQSEEFLGSFLRTKPRDAYSVSTKVGRVLVDDPHAVDGTDGFFGTPRRSRVRDYSAEGVQRSLEESLVRLGLDRVDTVFIHDPEAHMQQALDEAAPVLSALRGEGAIDSYGVGTNFTEVAETFIRETDTDRIMIAGRYSVLDRRAEDSLLALCRENGIRVLVAGVLNSGLLIDPNRAGATFNYEPAPDWLVSIARQMAEACTRYDVSLRAAALQFPLRNPDIEDLVTGAGRVASVHDTHEQLAVRIPPALWDELDHLAPDQTMLP